MELRNVICIQNGVMNIKGVLAFMTGEEDNILEVGRYSVASEALNSRYTYKHEIY